MSINREMNKEDVAIYNGYYSAIKKEQMWVICRDVIGPRVDHTE